MLTAAGGGSWSFLCLSLDPCKNQVLTNLKIDDENTKISKKHNNIWTPSYNHSRGRELTWRSHSHSFCGPDLSRILFCFWVVFRAASWHFKKKDDIYTTVTRFQTPTCAKIVCQVPQTVTLDWSAFKECWPHPRSASCINYPFNVRLCLLWISCCCVSHVDRHVRIHLKTV